ncbi:MAG: tRNA uridine-5-carboxymethylaminomethyl(34) synthesis GTPase MnmE [Ruminococcaceae bacterium]|nr:tRNA uridine-5-carboxymethylaminomethyl(34) synthesis GTPase MnmE [Oscillospiraceae bacterium]
MFHTVAAVSTPPGKGGVALIRISGEEAAAVADRMFIPLQGGKLSDQPPRRAVFGSIISPDTGEILDTGVAVIFRAPASYTGEDTAEISCHGGVAVTRATLAAAFAAGAEPAGPGDFTRRAFVNGKLTLTEAEAVGLLIDADTESRRALASGAVRGNLTRALDPIGDALSRVLSAIYAAIDYPDEDIGDEGEREIAGVIRASMADIDRLAATYKTGSAIAQGIPTAIAGLPNSGKSSLYNALLGSDDAIVTDIPGTTRDVLSAQADVGGVTLCLADTAGIRDGTDTVEMIGVERARQKIAQAALVLLVCDASQPLHEDFCTLARDVRESAPAAHIIAVMNKSDLPAAGDGETEKFLGGVADDVIRISAKRGDGMDALRAAVARAAGTDMLDVSSDAVIWDARQQAALHRAYTSLSEAETALCAGEPLDAVCMLCENALSEIRGVDGRAVDEEIVAGIFARFCVGK